MRLEYIEKMNNHSKWISYLSTKEDINNLFDPVIEEMYSLMHGALQRFILNNDEIVEYLWESVLLES